MRFVFSLRALLVGVVTLSQSVTSQAATPTATSVESPLVQERLTARDFQGAIEIAKKQQLPAQRDALLGQVVSAQLKSGSFSDAITTAAQIESDITRSAALREVGATKKTGGPGGGNANFGPLIDLITSTIEPDSWDDAGGPGAIKEYRNGIVVDAEGVLKQTPREEAQRWLSRFRKEHATNTQATEVRAASPLRKVSLPRLERAVQLRHAAGQPLDESMVVLAGLERIQYILIYPETGDLVLAGPAGDWKTNSEGRCVSVTSGRPVVRLDDLVTVWRHTANHKKVSMGCSITPVEANLAAAKAFLDESQKQPLKPGGRTKWLEEVRKRVGKQRIDVFGIDPTTGAARVLVEADYHMKLVGLGLAEGVDGVPSYLEMIKLPKGQSAPPIDVLRWWFTMKYDAVEASPERDAFLIRGQAVQLQSENEMLNDRGQRVHINTSEPLNKQFAENFTQHFAKLAEKYPVYAELQNLFDLALVGTLLETEGLAEQVGWHRTYFGADGECRVRQEVAPQAVDTVANHRMFNGRQIIASVSGGVTADPIQFVKQSAIHVDANGQLDSEHRRDTPAVELSRDQWWWD